MASEPLEVNRVNVNGKTYMLVFDDALITVSHGGTGRTSLTPNAILAGVNAGTEKIGMIGTQSGALYAVAEGAAAKFGVLPVKQGGTGETDIQRFREDLGLGYTLGALPIENGGTGADNADDAKFNLNIQETRFSSNPSISNNTLTAQSMFEYTIPNAIDKLTIKWPVARQGVIFGVNYSTSADFTGITFKDSTGATITSSVKLAGDGLKTKSTRYNLICWYDGASYWCAAKAG